MIIFMENENNIPCLVLFKISFTYNRMIKIMVFFFLDFQAISKKCLLQISDPGEGNGNPLQYSFLENPMDRGSSQATVHGVVKSWTGLSK